MTGPLKVFGMSRRIFAQITRLAQTRQCGAFSAARVQENVRIPRDEATDQHIVLSSHSNCEMHGMTLVQRVFQSASKWPDHIATVT